MKSKIVFTIAFLIIVISVNGQVASTWDNWSWLIGNWVGEGSGQPGKGGGSFTFKPDLNQKILIRKSHSEYFSTGNKPGVIHDDLMVIYPDYSGSPVKAIYFDNEGHTINYSITFSDKTIIFTSDQTLNIPVFRLTYALMEDQQVNTKFEISMDGENFKTYVEGKSTRIALQTN